MTPFPLIPVKNVFVSIKLVVVLCLPALLNAASVLQETGAQEVLIQSRDMASAQGTIAGSGISLLNGGTSLPAQTSSGAAIGWRQIRGEVDSAGNSHKFYRQTLLLPPHGQIDLLGSELGVHVTASGSTGFVGGTQFQDAIIGNIVSFSASEALEIAADRAASSLGTLIPPIAAQQRAQLLDLTKLQIIERNVGQFRIAYSVPVVDAARIQHTALIDAESGELYRLKTPIEFGDCNVTSNSPVSATGYGVRSGTARTLGASGNAARDGGESYEGYWWSSPNKAAFHGSFGTIYSCEPSTSYTLLPMTSTVYDDSADWKGRIAADALHHTGKVMEALSERGRNSWDGAGGEARILVQSEASLDNNAFFGDLGIYGPTQSVHLGKMTNGAHSHAVALDSIGHEWGHGVVQTSADFLGNGDSQSLREGFCDFIGMMAEKMKQGTGSGAEQSDDWRLGEDMDVNVQQYIRSGEDDDSSGHYWFTTAHFFNNALHKDDPDGDGDDYHNRGNMLNVVYRLLVDGGQNPICQRVPTLSGCSISVNPMSFTNATKVLFETLTYYAPSTTTWETLPTYASEATFFLFANCGLNHSALAQQEVVNKAFTAIGYPRPTSPETCN